MSQVVVVGAGNWGKNLVRNFHTLGALAGVAETNPKLRTKVEADYPGLVTYSDYQQVLESDISAIVLATPAPTHYKFAIAALEAGKDVFVEKPITLKTAEAKALAEYADKHSRILMVGHLLLYQPAIAWMRDYLTSGKAGKVLHVATQRAKLGKVRREENVWWSFAPHDVSVVLDLLGNPPIEKAEAAGQAILQPNIEDNIHVDLSFIDGQTAHLHCSWYWPLLQRSTTVITEEQMLVYDEVAQQVTVHHKGVDENLNNRDGGSQVMDFTASEPLRIECSHFLECLQTRKKPHSDGWNGLAVVDILEKAQEAMVYG
ncbi:Gfo/Idh/MocA family oxidoreductase [Mastigocoleus sp. MO_188.B34]|uniref:Gfo/Idh/MocA family protein n=1 Tax=Mastigocoleus sp. MO_188.B34 TaxID=3036635 RepID=UPI002636B072|nr:Gfo/Idh/MocA family oxidoreductase [Mastigocoleus sp. MO_188.B34]MDJ0696062.1 Gfo/Idh/MocA family oxidoreductase [Mastigocoleus sp. MO_188.B34]